MADCIFQIQILFSKNISLPTCSPVTQSLPHQEVESFPAPWIWAGAGLLWPTACGESNITWILRVSHQNQSASACFSWNIRSEGRQLPSGKSTCPEMAMLERPHRRTLVTKQLQLRSHSCHCTSLWEKPSQVFQPRRSISWVSVSDLRNAVRSKGVVPGSWQNFWAEFMST